MIVDKEIEQLKELKVKVYIINESFKIELLKQENELLSKQLLEKEFCKDIAKHTELLEKCKKNTKVIESYEELIEFYDYLNEFLEILKISEDEELLQEFRLGIELFNNKLENFINVV